MQPRANLNVAIIKAETIGRWCVVLVFLALLPNQAMALNLTHKEFGEQMGLYLGAANVLKSFSEDQCADALKVPDRYQEADSFIYQQLLKRKFTAEEARATTNNVQLLKFMDSQKSTYTKMLAQLNKQFGHPIGCGMILGVMQGIMQASSRVIENATLVQTNWLGPDNYDECILENIKKAHGDVAARLVRKSCANKFYDTSPEGIAEKERIYREEEQVQREQQVSQVGPMVNIDSFIVNISDDQESHYLKATITIEVDREAATMEVNQRMPQIKDVILQLIGNKTFHELNDSQGKNQLRAELINKINSILLKGKVKRIYFTDFAVQ